MCAAVATEFVQRPSVSVGMTQNLRGLGHVSCFAQAKPGETLGMAGHPALGLFVCLAAVRACHWYGVPCSRRRVCSGRRRLFPPKQCGVLCVA